MGKTGRADGGGSKFIYKQGVQAGGALYLYILKGKTKLKNSWRIVYIYY
jgi:hypothetical protein